MADSTALAIAVILGGIAHLITSFINAGGDVDNTSAANRATIVTSVYLMMVAGFFLAAQYIGGL